MKKVLVSLLRLCLSSTTFYYDGTVYQQTFGTAMGSPVLVVVAKYHLSLSMSSVPAICWKTYVADVLSAVLADHVDKMLALINSINCNVQFTSGRHVIPFLDVMMMHNDDSSISTKVYHKPTHTYQYLQFSFPHPTNGLLFPPYSRELLSTVLQTVLYKRRGHM